MAFVLDHLVHLSILVMLALSLNLINGFAGMFSLGHHGFFAVGAYAAAVVVFYGAQGSVPAGEAAVVAGSASSILWFVASLVVGIVAAGIFGFIVGVPCLRLRGDYLAIATLGFGEIVRILAQNTEAVGGARGMEVSYLLLERDVDTQNEYALLYAILVVALTAVTFVFIRNLIRSRHGRSLVSIREDEVAAELVGINLARAKLMAFVVGAAFAGLAGALYANYMTQIEPKEFNLIKGIYILLFVVLGGMGSLTGTIIAGFVLYVLDKIVLNLMPQEIQSLREVLFALILIILMISRPQGLLGHKELADTRFWQRLFRRQRGLKESS
ncbi:MAG: branched-chain amino acid ABC transporter permease [Myxococcales bacterium]|nr:branched-chain amino acid ABC transporter permease [Myxococcales bacterium]MCB9733249.1 branched-chain amino acid ABC transporter permease [Deltaproteobacteria bacterium]